MLCVLRHTLPLIVFLYKFCFCMCRLFFCLAAKEWYAWMVLICFITVFVVAEDIFGEEKNLSRAKYLCVFFVASLSLWAFSMSFFSLWGQYHRVTKCLITFYCAINENDLIFCLFVGYLPFCAYFFFFFGFVLLCKLICYICKTSKNKTSFITHNY